MEECSAQDVYYCKKLTNNAILDVIAVVSNPVQYSIRYKLFGEFCERMRKNPLVRLKTIELQQRARPFATDSDIKLRTKDEIWYKENLINIAIGKLPKDWEYVAWIDTDLLFLNENWARDTIEQLQIYSVVQLWTHAIDLGPNGEILQVHTGFMYQYINKQKFDQRYGNYWHPGYAWACRRSAYNYMGGLIEFSILGAGDHHMALCLIGEGQKGIPKGIHPNYLKMIEIFQNRCEKNIKRNVGFVRGAIAHFFHGDKKNRKYYERWQILIRNQYDPVQDISRDDQGLLQLSPDKIELRDDIRTYFRERNEDSLDLLQDYMFTKSRFCLDDKKK